MTGGREQKQWTCGKSRIINLHKVSSMVRDIGDPCLSQSHIKDVIAINRMLKPDKWQATFDSEGKVTGFNKALKLIILGGADPSIRPEVWEFLLGCYALSSTAECRRRLRTARRERFKHLIEQCQKMNSSVGTGSLAYVVGSKVMDMRTSSKCENKMEAKIKKRTASDNSCELEKCNDSCSRYNNCTDTENSYKEDISSELTYPVSLRRSMDCSAHNHSSFTSISGPKNCSSSIGGVEADGSDFIENGLDFPPLPVTDLFEQRNKDERPCVEYHNRQSTKYNCSFQDEGMHSFRINNNADLVIESKCRGTTKSQRPISSEIEIASPDNKEGKLNQDMLVNRQQMTTQIIPSYIPESPRLTSSPMQGRVFNDERVSEWLWTLHRIVVDVVRTDNHLEFYRDTRNLARMSDILAVYAWVDPTTGYCQGMSDLLSPFVVLFEDNADAFWCFEMLLRRMRQNFQMEGPTGVMKQLQALWQILEFADREMFAHLSHIGAESLHFAFRMLLVLFRRELSFSEALSMWEMMWAADFCESLVYDLEDHCLEALVVNLPDNSGSGSRYECADTDESNAKSSGNGFPSDHHNENGSIKVGLRLNDRRMDQISSEQLKWKSRSSYPFCGFTKNFWSKNNGVQISTGVSFTRNGGDELAVFCVAAILIINRQKIIRETRSFDDMIKIFNDNILKINIRRCIHMAIRLRKKYFYKQTKRKRRVSQNGE